MTLWGKRRLNWTSLFLPRKDALSLHPLKLSWLADPHQKAGYCKWSDQIHSIAALPYVALGRLEEGPLRAQPDPPVPASLPRMWLDRLAAFPNTPLLNCER